MKSKIVAFLFFSILPAVMLAMAVCPSTAAALDVIVTINHIEDTLNLIDGLSGSGSDRAKPPATAVIRAMLQGTDWIDDDRQIAIGLELSGDRYIGAVRIPYRHPNDNFQTIFSAQTRPGGYYLVALPPGAAQMISEPFEAELVRAASLKSKTTLLADIAVARLLTKNREQVNRWLEKFERSENPQTHDPMAPTSEEARAMISGMLEKASQVDILSLGIDASPSTLAVVFGAQARAQSELARLFTRTDTPTRLGDFRPAHQIHFRSGPYDIAGSMEMMGSVMGPFYQKLGFDFGDITALGKSFSGEMAGGLSYDEKGFNFEVISVLKDKVPPVDFLETVYLPRIEHYSQHMAGLLEDRTGRKLADVFVRTADSQVAGCQVVGVRSKIPVFPDLPQTPGTAAADFPVMVYDTRMTVVDNLLLMASDDQYLEKMIGLARAFAPSPLKGPLMTLDMDLGAYFSAMGGVSVPGGGSAFEGLGKVTFTMDLENGRIETVASFGIADIKAMVAAFQKPLSASPAGSPGSVTGQAMARTEPGGGGSQWPVKKPDAEKDPAYWFEKGELAATYGNDRDAVAFFEKAIRLDPAKSDAYFKLSVSYCELGETAKALGSINSALAMDGENGAYYYTRARIYLLSDQRDKALADFIQSARLDHKDARDYLKNVAHVQWE